MSFMQTPKEDSNTYARLLNFDEWTYITPRFISNNTRKRARKHRYLLKKWDTQIAVHQIKERLNGHTATPAEEIAVRLESEEFYAQRARRSETLRASSQKSEA